MLFGSPTQHALPAVQGGLLLLRNLPEVVSKFMFSPLINAPGMARLRRRDILVAFFYSTVSKNSQLHEFLSSYNPTERYDVGGVASKQHQK